MLIRYTIIFVNLLSIVFLTQFWAQSKNKFEGLSFWAVGYSLQVFGFFLDLLNLPIPPRVADFLISGLVIIGMFLLVMGLERFLDIKRNERFSVFSLATFMGLMAYFVVINPISFISENFLGSYFQFAAVSVIAFRGSWVLLKKAKRSLRPITRSVGWIMFFYGLVALTGIILVDNVIPSAPMPPALGLLNMSIGWIVPISTSLNLLTLAITYGLIVMVSQRLLLEIKESEEHHRRVVNFLPDSILIQIQGKIVFSNKAADTLLGVDHATQLIDKKMTEFWSGNHQPFTTNLPPDSSEKANRGEPMEEKFKRVSGDWVDVEVAELPFSYRNKPAVLTVLRDITERNLLKEERRKAREKIRQQLQFLRAAIESMDEPFYVINVADRTIEISNEAAKSLNGNLRLPCHSTADKFHDSCSNSEKLCPFQMVLTRKEPVVVENTYLDQNGNEVFVEVHSSPILDLQGDVVQVVEYMVDISASRRAAAVEERNRLAQELHDAVSQTLFAASIVAETVPEAWQQDPQVGRRGIEEVQQLTHGALAEMRMLLLELRPQEMIENSFGNLVRHLAEAVTSRHQVPIHLMISHDDTLSPDVQLTFYRLVQESLNNIVKHAGASQIDIFVNCHSDRVNIRIEDDGCGFNVNDEFPGHMGLHIMRERAQKIDADLTIESVVGQGTAISLVWSAVESGR